MNKYPVASCQLAVSRLPVSSRPSTLLGTALSVGEGPRTAKMLMRFARDVVAAAPDEKIQVGAEVGLLHVLDVEPRVAARRELQLRSAPFGAPPGQLSVA